MRFYTKEWYALMQGMGLSFKKIPDGNYTGAVGHPESAQEVREDLEAQYRQALDEFENRPPFDSAETVDFFETSYQTKLNYYKDTLPAWMTEQVDRR
jgi:hypothetical protein